MEQGSSAEHLARAMADGIAPVRVIEELFAAARAWIAEGEPPLPRIRGPHRDKALGTRLARHAASMLRNGATPPAALDDVLVLLLHRGERAAIAAEPAGDRAEDPLDVRPIARRYEDYAARLAAGRSPAPRSLRNTSRNLQLMTTRRCQLRCAYCPVVKGDRDMPREIMDRAVDLLVGSARDSVRLDFSGGEPLLRRSEVLATAERLRSRAGARGKRANFYMVTNGFEMDRPLAEQLKELGFRVEFSLDGDEELHNRWKIPVDIRDNPYRRTRQAIDVALETGLDHTVVMVVTPQTVGRLEESFAHLVSCGIRSIDVNYAIGSEWRGDPLVTYLTSLERAFRSVRAQLEDGEIELGNLASRVEPAVLNAEWMVDTDGSLHLMTEWALESSRGEGAEDLALGHVANLSSWDDLHAGRFQAYLALLRTYAWRDGRLRRILHDNVAMGRAVARHLTSLSWSWR